MKEGKTESEGHGGISRKVILYIRSFRFALSRFSTTFAVFSLSPFMRRGQEEAWGG